MNRFFSEFSPRDNVFCEAFLPDGSVRDHWAMFIQSLEAMETGEFEKLILESRKILGKHGATYDLFTGGERQSRPWELDLIPHIILAGEWQFLEQSLIQRATLIDALLRDLYTGQSLVREGTLPPESITAFPGFLRPCRDMVPDNFPFLTFLAVDLIRDAAGRWQVANHFTQMPEGLGFALENRLITSQVISRIFHQNRVMRLAPFFITLKDQLNRTGLFNRTDPEVLMLSAGPGKASYFEQALLSRYLGYPMVESGDLTVRDNRVFVKMLGGLEPVDVLLRYVPDLDCDPLALRTGATTGVPGLIQAVRHKALSLANPIGAGLAETPVFSKFYPDLCRRLLGQDLMLPDLPVNWCRNPEEMETVLSHPEDFFIQEISDPGNPEILDGATLSQEQKEALAQKIRFSPYAWFARSKPALAEGLSLGPDLGLVPGQFACRFFVCACDGGFSVMPGGLAMDVTDMHALYARKHMTVTKDIWVLSDKPVAQVTLMGGMDQAVDIRRQTDLPSRAADNLLWLGRHLETAECRIRLLRAIFMRLSGEVPYREMTELPLLFAIAAQKGLVNEDHMKENQDLALFPMQEELIRSVFDPERPGGLYTILENIRQTAYRVRDRLSQDSWQILSRLTISGHSPHPVQWIEVSNTYEVLDDLLVSLSAFSGLTMENITRGTTWRFVDMGKRLVRAKDLLTTVLTAMSPPPQNLSMALETLLELADSAMTYRFRYRTRLRTAPVMDLLLFDELNPRSLAFQLAALSNHVDHLPRGLDRKYSSQEEKALLAMLTAVRLAEPAEICEPDMRGERQKLTRLIRDTDLGLADFSTMITQHYLSRIPTTRHFSSFEDRGRP